MASVKLNHVYKVYPNGVKAVKDFSMTVEDKEFLVFVGPSGCGKSTTLRMIAGLEDISNGEIYIDGTLVNDVEPKDRDIAMVFQNYALYPHMTVYENMAFGLKIRRIPSEEIHRRVLEAAEILGITEYLGKKPKAMSGGQRQRVALGRAIVREPKVFLLDEPLSNLDAKLRTQMRAEISKLHNKLKTTFIYVTHDQTEAMTMGTRIVVMRDGEIQQIDTPANLYRYPESKFVASFIGSPQMNFYRVRLKERDDVVELRIADTNILLTPPASLFRKMDSEFLKNGKDCILGIRAEKIVPAKESDPDAIPCIVSNVEELGDETLIYGDLREDSDSVVKRDTDVVFRLSGENHGEIHPGDRLYVSLDLRYAHYFDPETEMSVCPRMPQKNALEGYVRNRALILGSVAFPLPPVLVFDNVEGRKLAVEIPADAVTVGGKTLCRVLEAEQIGDKTLTHLQIGDKILFAEGSFGNAGSEVGVSLDFRKITFFQEGKSFYRHLPLYNRIYGTVRREKRKQRGKKKITYCFEMAGAEYSIPDAILTGMVKTSGPAFLKKRLRYEGPLEAFSIAEEGIPAHVKQYLDYGTRKYLLAEADGNRLIVPTDSPRQGNIRVKPNLAALTYIDDELDVILH